jgi:4-amino-4-deoxy-L-arabinose transferase-like glycosyltransferase
LNHAFGALGRQRDDPLAATERLSVFARISLPALLVAGATIVAAIIVFSQIDAKPFWLDEATSVAMTRNATQLARAFAHDGGNFALYYVLLYAWLHAGTTEVWVRTLSVLPALATIPVAAALARRLFDTRTGIATALIVAVHPFFIAYAHEARGYSLAVLAVTTAGYALTRARQDAAARGAWTLFVVAAAAAVYTQMLCTLVLFAFAIWLGLTERRAAVWKPALVAASTLAVLVFPLALAEHRSGHDFLAWIPPATLPMVAHDVATLFGGPDVLAVVAASALLFPWLRYRPSRRERDAWMLLFAWLVVPVGGLIVYSLVRHPLLVERYLIISLPAAAIACAAILVRIAAVPRLAPLAAIAIVLAVRSDIAAARTPPDEDWRATTAFLATHARTTDTLFIRAGYAKVPFDYNVEQSGKSAAMPAFVAEPAALFEHHSAGTYLARVIRHSDRVWLILSHADKPDDPARSGAFTVHALERDDVRSATWQFGRDITLALYIPRKLTSAPPVRVITHRQAPPGVPSTNTALRPT